MRYLRTISRRRPAEAQSDQAFQKIALAQAVFELLIVLRDGLGIDLISKDDSSGS